MESAKISVVVPIYNVESYLRRCLTSIIDQTHRNLQIILIDDDSPDNCGKICDEYAKKDERIVVLHQDNAGAAAARNLGLEVAAGDWVGFVDGDDYIEPDQYEYLLDLARRYGADISQCGMFYEKQGQVELKHTPTRDTCVDSDHITAVSQFLANSSCCRIYRKEIIRGIRFDAEYLIGEDLLFNLQLLKKANKTALGCEAKYHYVQRPDSTCNSPPTQRTLVSFRAMLKKVKQEYSEENAFGQYCSILQLRNDLDMCSKIVRYRLDKENVELVHELREELRKVCQTRFAGTDFSTHEKSKAFLISYAWAIYKTLLLLKGELACRLQNT